MDLRPLLVLAFAACSGWQPNPTHVYHLEIDSQFSAAQYQAIADAATEWQQSSANYVTFDFVPSANDVIAFRATSVAQIRTEFGGGAIGYTEYEGQSSNIDLGTSLDAEMFHQTALHEIGHALGLKHTTPGTVMCMDTTCATLEITCGDLVQLLGYAVVGCTP
jgi:predicted Zn-dependent protease